MFAINHLLGFRKKYLFVSLKIIILPEVKILKKSEPFFKQNKKDSQNEVDELVDDEKGKLMEQVFAVLYMIFITGLVLAVLMELKMEYQIDLFPGINTPFDDVYRDAKNVFSGEAPPPPPEY